MRERLNLFCGTEDPLALKLRGGGVRRYHAEGRAFDQTVAEHTWRLMVILLELWPNASPALVKTALYHDVAEGYLGDVHAPLKRHFNLAEAVAELEQEFELFLAIPRETQLCAWDLARLKCADYIELCLTCEPRSRSNTLTRASQIFEVGAGYISVLAKTLPEEEQGRIVDIMTRIRNGELS